MNDGAKIAKITSGSGAKLMQTDETQTSDAPVEENEVQLNDEVRPADDSLLFIRETRQSHVRYNAHHSHVPSDENDVLIETINNMDLGWKADTCKYQKHHSKYGSHCEQTLTLAQTKSKDEA